MTTIPELYQQWVRASEESASFSEDDVAFNDFCDRVLDPIMAALFERRARTMQELAMKFRVFDDGWSFNPMKGEIDELIGDPAKAPDILVLATPDHILVWNGRGGYSDIREHSIADIVEKFDKYAAWAQSNAGTSDINSSEPARELVLRACEEGRIIADAVDSHRGKSS